MANLRRRMYARTAEDGSFDTGMEEYDADAEMDVKAHAYAERVQSNIGEAYRSPFTYNAAFEAAKIVLADMQRGEEEQRAARFTQPSYLDDPHLARRALDAQNYGGLGA